MVGVYIYCQKVWGDWEEILVVSYRVWGGGNIYLLLAIGYEVTGSICLLSEGMRWLGVNTF